MKKNQFYSSVLHAILKQRLLLLFTWIFLFACCLTVFARGYAQDTKVSLEVKNMQLKEVLLLLEQKGKVHFLYMDETFPSGKSISLTAKNELLLDVLQKLLQNTGLSYKVVNEELIVLSAGDRNKEVLVEGRVTGENGEPLIGVSVQADGSQTGTATDNTGEYRLSVPDNGSIRFTYIGYEPQVISVNGRKRIDVMLKSDPAQAKLNEVVVVGYGSQKRADVTGSVASVPKNRLTNIPVTNVLQQLQGAVPGLNITQGSSAPGSSANVLVRGVNSISATTAPLIILDGVPFPGSSNDINPADIESVSVLKDASAVAIYGTRGSNGIIIITTRRGLTGKPVIRYNGYTGLEFRAHTLHPLDGPGYVQKNLDYNKQRGVSNTNPVNDSVPNASEIANFRSGKTTDWLDEISRQGIIQDHNLSISGGTKDVKYYVSGEYLKDNGILKGYQYQRVNIRSNLDANLTDWLSAGTSFFYTNNNYDGGKVNLTQAGQMSPYGQEYNADGTYAIYPMFPVGILYPNPLIGLYQQSLSRANNLTGTGYIEIKPATIPGLKYRLNASYSYLPTRNNTYNGRNTGDLIGHAYLQNEETKNWLLENILTYTKDIGKHHFDVTSLYSAQKNLYFFTSLSSNTFINDQLGFNNAGAGQIQTNTSSSSVYSLVSQMGRLNYAYEGKYLLTATARRDGYSGFGAYTNKHATFPSVAVGWNISKEHFMDGIPQLNNLKLRASYGTTGNSAVSPYQTLNRQGVAQYIYNNTTVTGLVASTIGNPNLKWESTTGLNIGIDFSLLNNRISGTIETYRTNTNNLLLRRNLPTITGYSNILDNIGKLRNKGIDLLLNTVNLKIRNFSWETNLNISSNGNKIVQLYGDGKSDIGNRWFIGKSLQAIYDYRQTGVWQQGEDNSAIDPSAKPGDLKFADQDGSKTITSRDRVYLGSSLPSWIGAMTNTFRYRNFQFSFFIQTFQGGLKYNGVLNYADQAGAVNIPAETGYWTETNKNNLRPSLRYTNPYGYGYPSKANYTRIKDVSLSYNVPPKVLDRYGIGSMSVYISGRNLHTFTNWIGWDPENDYNGGTSINYNNYPLVATYVLGLNLTLK